MAIANGVIAQISAVMRHLAASGIGKDGHNKAQDFHFRGIDAIHNALAPLLVQEGLVICPSVIERTTEKRERSGKDPLYFSVVKVGYTIYSTVDGTHVSAGPFYGEAMDSGDKATNKAMSIAYKYFAIQTFCIPLVGTDDPDAHGEAADVGALKQAMTDAKTVDELRARTGDALSALGKGHDEYQDVVAYGRALAARFSAVKQPTEKAPAPEKAAAEEPAPEQEQAAAPSADKPSAGLLASIRKMAKVKNYGLDDDLSNLSKTQAAKLLATISAME